MRRRRAHENVFRLDVAVDHSFGVGRAEAFGDLAGDGEGEGDVEGLGRVVEEGSEVGAVNELHGEEEGSILGWLQISRVYYIFMPNLAQGADFAQEAGGEGLVVAQIAGQKFEGLRLVHERVLGEIDGSHAALAELADDAVGVADDHAGLEVANLVKQHTMRGAGGVAVGIAGGALWAGFHALTLLNFAAEPL